jgi:hypothetical protein
VRRVRVRVRDLDEDGIASPEECAGGELGTRQVDIFSSEENNEAEPPRLVVELDARGDAHTAMLFGIKLFRKRAQGRGTTREG